MGEKENWRKISFSHEDILNITRILRNVFIGKGDHHFEQKEVFIDEKIKHFLCPQDNINFYEIS